MKALMINGSPNEKGRTFAALTEVAKTLAKHDIESELLYLGKKPAAGWIARMKRFKTGMNGERAPLPVFEPRAAPEFRLGRQESGLKSCWLRKNTRL